MFRNFRENVSEVLGSVPPSVQFELGRRPSLSASRRSFLEVARIRGNASGVHRCMAADTSCLAAMSQFRVIYIAYIKSDEECSYVCTGRLSDNFSSAAVSAGAFECGKHMIAGVTSNQ